MPAAPALAATKKVRKSGELMRFAKLWSSWSKPASKTPAAFRMSAVAQTTLMASAKPTRSAEAERRAS